MSITKVINSTLHPMDDLYSQKKETNTNIVGINNNNKVYNKELKIQKKEKNFSLNNANNYVYLGSTNMPLLNNMGITLTDDGSLMLIKGKTYDLFTGLYQKHIKNGFKYNVFNIESKTGEDMRFKELYVDSQGYLIGNRRSENQIENKDKINSELYKIKFSKIEKDYNLKDDSLSEIDNNFIIEYERYVVESNLKHDLSSINNIIEIKENNILKLNREGLNITIEVKDNQLVTTGLPATLLSKGDEVDSEAFVKKHKIRLPLKKTDKILAIKPILNQVQLVVDKGNKIKIYYLDPLNIFAIKDYQYEVTRLKQEPPLSFYSMIGENNYKNYHSGQPFSTQTIGNFSSRHIPFVSSFIDNARIHIDKAKQQYALKKYDAMVKNIAKSIDPGFRGIFSNIKGLTNSSSLPNKSKNIALYSIKKNIHKDYEVINRVIKGINNGIKQGEVIYSLVKELKKNESITISHDNDIRAFFGINVFNLSGNMGVNAFILANYAKNHSLILSKNEKDKVIFSFINKANANVSGGLSAGITSYNKQWQDGAIDYGLVTPVMASVLLDINYKKHSSFSFTIELKNVSEFINKGLDLSENELQYNSILETNKKMAFSLGSEIRSEINLNIETNLNPDTKVIIPRNAIGTNFALNLMKLDLNINKLISYGEIESKSSEKKVNLDFFEFYFEFYRDLKITPSTTSSTNHIQWYPLATVKNFETMLQKKINSLFRIPVYDSEYNKKKKEFEEKRKDLKGIYKRTLKLNKLFDTYPNEYDVSSSINKLDNIYLSLSANKKQSNKLDGLLQSKKLNPKDNLINQSTYLTNENTKLKQFLSDLKERKETLSSQEKDNMNEKFKPYFISKYQLDPRSKEIYNGVKTRVQILLDEVRVNKNLNLNEIKNKLDNLYNESKKELNKVKYYINSIDVMSVSELADKGKSLPLIFLRLGSKKSISHHQIKGEIKFSYDENRAQLEKISTNYYF